VLAKIGDDHVLPDIERLIGQREDRASEFSLWNLSSFSILIFSNWRGRLPRRFDEGAQSELDVRASAT